MVELITGFMLMLDRMANGQSYGEGALVRSSPTIRINGRDVAGDSSQLAECAVSCRLCPSSERIGLPPVEWDSAVYP